PSARLRAARDAEPARRRPVSLVVSRARIRQPSVNRRVLHPPRAVVDAQDGRGAVLDGVQQGAFARRARALSRPHGPLRRDRPHPLFPWRRLGGPPFDRAVVRRLGARASRRPIRRRRPGSLPARLRRLSSLPPRSDDDLRATTDAGATAPGRARYVSPDRRPSVRGRVARRPRERTHALRMIRGVSGIRAREAAIAVSEHRVRVGGDEVLYRVAGEGEPVVMLHGLGGSSRCWTWTAPALARRYRVYLVDLPGFGVLRRLHRRFALGTASAWLEAWMHAAKIGRAHLVGHSMGALISTRLVAA